MSTDDQLREVLQCFKKVGLIGVISSTPAKVGETCGINKGKGHAKEKP